MRVDDLVKPRGYQEVLQALLNELTTRGWGVTDFEPGGVGRTLVEAFAAAVADLEILRANIARSGYLSTATGPWLDLLANEYFGLERKPATHARVKIRLEAEPEFGPYTISPHHVIAYIDNQRRYINIEGGVLPPGGTLLLPFEAEGTGSFYNLPPNTTVYLHTPLPGVTATTIETIRAGGDEETDEELRERCLSRWHTLGAGTRAAYQHWALSAASEITAVRVLDQHPNGQGSVDVVVWGSGAPVNEDILARVQNYIQERAPLGAAVRVYNATPRHINVTATVLVRPGWITSAQANGATRLAELQRQIGIGGRVYRSALIDVLFARGVVSVDLTSPVENVFLDGVEVPILVPHLTYVEEA